MTAVEKLLDRLGGVRQTGPKRWLARCPAHDDRSPSLAVRETDDGAVLIYDHGGCDFADVLASIGLEPCDLFPQQPLPVGVHYRRGPSRPFSADDALICLYYEAVILLAIAADLERGEPLAEADRNRLRLAAGRIAAALEVCNAHA